MCRLKALVFTNNPVLNFELSNLVQQMEAPLPVPKSPFKEEPVQELWRADEGSGTEFTDVDLLFSRWAYECPHCGSQPISRVIMTDTVRPTYDYWSGASGQDWEEIAVCKNGHSYRIRDGYP